MFFFIFLDFVDTLCKHNCGYRKEVSGLASKLGRPTDDPKILSTRIRLSSKDLERLEFCVERTGLKKSDIIRLGIQKVYDELAK